MDRLTDNQRYYLHRKIKSSVDKIFLSNKVGIIYVPFGTKPEGKLKNYIDRLIAKGGYSVQYTIPLK